MTVSTFFSGSEDGRIISVNTVYTTARTGSNLVVNKITAGGGTNYVGQVFLTPDYTIGCLAIPFDTSSIPDTDTISSVELSVMGQFDQDTTGFTIEARAHDCGATFGTEDWLAGGDIASKPLLASFTTSGWVLESYNVFASESAFTTWINKTGTTWVYLLSDRFRTSTIPTGNNERVGIYCSEEVGTTKDPRLVVTHDAAGGGAATRRALLGVGV